MILSKFENYDVFNEQECDFCGICFSNCPVLELPIDKAQQEIKSLVSTGKSDTVLNKCTSCMACNHYCPNNCNPHTLILQSWNKRYLDEGLPNRSKLALPYHFPNLYTLNIKKLPDDEVDLIEQWTSNWQDPPENNRTMLYTGCNMLLQPYILKSDLFKDIPIFGSPELCCGEPLYRMGCLDAAEQVGHYLQQQFENMGFKQLIVACLAGYHMFKEVYESVYDIKFNFEVVSIVDWLWDELKSGKYDVKQLKSNAVIHDNCWAKASGDHFFNRTRELLEYIGVEIIEPNHTKESALCCGIGAAASCYSIRYAFKSAKQRIKEFKKSGADIVLDYCGGCNWYFSSAQTFSIKKIPIYNIVELVQKAIGETPLHRTKKRGKKILRAVLWKGLASYLKSKKYKIDNIMGLPVPRKD